MLDTHKIVKRLESSGFTSEQAETITAVVVENQQEGFSALAIKEELKFEIGLLRSEMKTEFSAVRGEIAGLRGETKTEFAAVRGEIAGLRGEMKTEFAAVRGEIKGLKAEMLQWFIGAMIAFSGIIIAAFKMISGH